MLLAMSSTVFSQDYNLDPTFGYVEVVSGFEPDPAEYSLYAGGELDLSKDSNLECVGFVSDAPDFRLTYSDLQYDYPLGFVSESEVDTVMLINAPDGSWHCNDDYSDEFGFNAGVQFLTPQEGVFDIWIGVFDEADLYTAATLLVTEVDIRENPEDDESQISGGNQGSGTGFTINELGHLLTNYHVIEECNSLTFQLPGQNAVPASVVATDERADLALLATNISTVPAVFDFRSRPRLGDEIVVYGFPLLGDLSSQGNLTTGVVSALTGLNDDSANFQISAQIQPGNSGGPVLSRNGVVAGVVVSMANDRYFMRQSGANPQNVNFAISGKLIRAFLLSNGIEYTQASTAQPSLSIADIAEIAQRYTGAVMCY